MTGQTEPVSTTPTRSSAHTLAWAELAAPPPIRRLGVGVTDVGVALVTFLGEPAAAARRTGFAVVTDAARTDPVVAQLRDYLAGRRQDFELALDWSLFTVAQRTVLQALCQIGYGRTTTYGELARLSGAFDHADGVLGARAVGSVMGANPIPVIVPCHRVLAADGLGGFGGGLAVKRWLLELEGALPPALDFG